MPGRAKPKVSEPFPTHSVQHQKLRAALLRRYVPGVSICARGKHVMYETDPSKIELDHDDDRSKGYIGLSCRACNRADGAVKAGYRSPRSVRFGGKVSPGRQW